MEYVLEHKVGENTVLTTPVSVGAGEEAVRRAFACAAGSDGAWLPPAGWEPYVAECHRFKVRLYEDLELIEDAKPDAVRAYTSVEVTKRESRGHGEATRTGSAEGRAFRARLFMLWRRQASMRAVPAGAETETEPR